MPSQRRSLVVVISRGSDSDMQAPDDPLTVGEDGTVGPDMPAVLFNEEFGTSR
jgi:hypothetical protein